jgi:Ca-activated chloride channel family protein
MPLKDQFGNKHYQMVQVDVDEDTLKRVAETTDGKFFRATDTESLKEIYAIIDKMEKTEVKVKKFQNYQELFAWFLIPGLALLGVEVWLTNTRFRRLP